MKRFIWDYEDALVNRDAAVTWILCCKKGLMHKDTAKIIALYVFNGFEYANGILQFIFEDGGVHKVLLWEQGICKQYNTHCIVELSHSLPNNNILYFINTILDFVYAKNNMSFYNGVWHLNDREPTKHQRLQILAFLCDFEIPKPFNVCSRDVTKKTRCNTIGDVVNFMKSDLCSTIIGTNMTFTGTNEIYDTTNTYIRIRHRYKFNI